MKDIKGWEGKYAVTKDGRVWAYPKIQLFKRRDGSPFTKKYRSKWLSNNTTKRGYKGVNLHKDGIPTFFYVHRLVAMAFIPNPFNYSDINHLDNTPSNNRVENLEWCTESRNMKYSYDTGNHKPIRGEAAWCAKLTEKDVHEIRRLCKEHRLLNREIAKIFGVSRGLINNIHHRRKWKHI